MCFLKQYRLPRWLSGKASAYQCRRLGLRSWVGKIPWRRKWKPTLVFLPGKSHGQWRFVGYHAWGCRESDTSEMTEHACMGASRKWAWLANGREMNGGRWASRDGGGYWQALHPVSPSSRLVALS